MSALTPHIRVLRAEAAALKLLAPSEIAGVYAYDRITRETLAALATAKTNAADALEAEDHALNNRLMEIPARGQS